MNEADAIKSIINMLQSQRDNIRRSAGYLLSTMMEHSMISHPRTIIALTDAIQRTYGMP